MVGRHVNHWLKKKTTWIFYVSLTHMNCIIVKPFQFHPKDPREWHNLIHGHLTAVGSQRHSLGIVSQ